MSAVTLDRRALDDLAEFARAENAAADAEPWAAVLAAMELGDEQRLWAVHLYNATDDLNSAFTILEACPDPHQWAAGDPRTRATAHRVYLGGERRNLRGGKISQRLDSYAAALAGATQHHWINEATATSDPYRNFTAVMPYLRRVWGVGRLAAFEWAEFLAKAGRYRIETHHGALWESSGPRESLERIWNGGRPAAALGQLDEWADATKEHLAAAGAPLSWWDFETVVCDFNVMRKGRYYPGKHLAMIRGEIDALDEPWRSNALTAYRKAIPEGWRDLPGQVDKQLARAYRDTGRITYPDGVHP